MRNKGILLSQKGITVHRVDSASSGSSSPRPGPSGLQTHTVQVDIEEEPGYMGDQSSSDESSSDESGSDEFCLKVLYGDESSDEADIPDLIV
ncbi:hypothetical protein GCM10023116_11150 [Kistimonas scapharcae]|uniref:Uncharacterized protein n=1 Tax=Kistimonas scapharcae TaxID=1036133 RepID=A0ABP8UZ84_9GAMM